ncbi:hypothetical protein Tco_0644209 [Tanacetum coccineum]
MSTLAEFMILASADNRPPMLEKHLYDSWKSRMELYMQNIEHGRMILESVEHGPLIWPTIEENGVTRTKKYEELSATEKIQVDCDLKATSIILEGLPSDVYSLVNHHIVAKDLWERVQLLMQGTSLTKQERECKLYDAFDKFAHIKGESLHHLSPEWSKFVTDVKLVRDLHTTNFEQLHAYLEQHELYANEVRIRRECNQDPLALIDFDLAVPVFKQGDDPIDAINKMMSFLSIVVSSCFPTTNNQLRNSSNPRQQATIHEGRVIVQPVQGRQSSIAAGTSRTRANILGIGGNNSGQQRVVKYFNCQGEGHIARQCPKPKRKRDATWFRDKVLLVKAQGSGKVLNEEELEFLADPGVAEDVLSEVPHSKITYTNVISITDSEKTLMLEEESRSKMLLKQSDPMVLEKKLQTLHPNTDQSASSPIKIKAPRELPKMKAAVQQVHVDKQCFEIQKKQFLIENDRLLDQIISQDIVNIVVNYSMDINTFVNVNDSVTLNASVNYVEMCNKCLELEAELIKQHNMVKKDKYNRISKSFSNLEQHCISFELAIQLNIEIFQKHNTSVNQTEPSFD